MDLKLKEVAEIFQVSEKTIYRWINDKKLPCYKLNHQYRFDKDEIDEWIIKNRIGVTVKRGGDSGEHPPPTLIEHIKRGGVFYKITGGTVSEVLRNCVDLIHLPDRVSPDALHALLLKREEMMSTGLGNGIALPHPREPIMPSVDFERVSVCFLHEPMDFNAIDGRPVGVLFIILSADQSRHLQILAELSFACRNERFAELLKNEPLREEIVNFLASLR